jgi:hypothetical protein
MGVEPVFEGQHRMKEDVRVATLEHGALAETWRTWGRGEAYVGKPTTWYAYQTLSFGTSVAPLMSLCMIIIYKL